MKVKVWLSMLSAMVATGCNTVEHDTVQYKNLMDNTVSNKNPVVFIHGAHLKAASWSLVQENLTKANIPSHTINLPGRTHSSNPEDITITYVAQAMCDELQKLSQPLSLVVHSQGGAIAHKTLTLCNNIQVNDIVYVSAVAPINGAKPFSLLSKKDEENYFAGVKYENGWMKIANKSAFLSTFTDTQSVKLKEIIMSNSVDEPAITGEGKVQLNKETLKNINKSYIYAKNDKIISFESQQRIAESIGIKNTYTIDSGHLPMITQPVELSKAIVAALRL
jgi:pimeloyl-ACP methyl ester carboxylesterase